jgi:protoporphyrinogen oxidase
MKYPENPSLQDCIVIGGGLAGLTAARQLAKHRLRVTLIEAQSRLGGRVQSDLHEGYVLDHGFQVYLTAYPTASSQLDLSALQLGVFTSGALVRIADKFHQVSDPLREPSKSIATLLAPVGSLADKLRIFRLRREVINQPGELLRQHFGDICTEEYLMQQGFSKRIIDRFFRPFFGGIFLDSSLSFSASTFRYLFRIFSMGNAALPIHGMQAIPNQIADQLGDTSVMLNTTVTNVTSKSVGLSDGRELKARHVIVATESTSAARLLGTQADMRWQSTVCLYFSADKPPITDATLVLNGDDEGPINTIAVLSNAQPSYAPKGKSLINVSCIGNCNESLDQLRSSVMTQLKRWYADEVDRWQFLRAYYVPYALPVQSPNSSEPKDIIDGIHLAGDYLQTASIEGAIQSGLSAAGRILAGVPPDGSRRSATSRTTKTNDTSMDAARDCRLQTKRKTN